ncbi:hypothetical protein SteCoe_7281 [Stentor coeruleus]|uniref:JmjC domain-containing protein n=1 Tax=Stentor coeruleus TaxID=5963 RepID=A0A1R2CN29_9CILI|nr:hypothetical protein SteCoe_7281 [Stentor coeruleus]
MIDLQQFSQKYSKHLDWPYQQPISTEDQSYLYTLYNSVQENGGWLKTIALNNWQELSQNPNPRSLYESKFLVSFEYQIQGLWNISPQQTLALNYSHLKSVPIFTNITNFDMNNILNEDLAMIKNICDLGIKKDLISLESLIRKFLYSQIIVQIQEPETLAFNAKTSKKQMIFLKDCIKLIEKSYKIEKHIRFDMDINFGNFNEEIFELSKHIPLKILWFNDNNSINQLKHHILNMTIPELYIEIKNCFTSCEENLCFPKAYINHGPNPCEWWGLDRSQSLKFFEHIKNDKGFEIYNTENLWWIDEMYCISKGLKIYHTIQQPGDMILINQGTIHWVKSCGITINSSWNYGCKYINTLKSHFEKYFIKKVIKYKSLIPIHKLSMDFLNLELGNLDLTLVEILKEHVQYKSSIEENEYIESEMLNLEINNIEKIMNCEMCNQELFRFYYKCTKCYDENIILKNLMCYFCYLCSKNIHRLLCNGKIIPVQKFSNDDYKNFIYKLDMRLKEDNIYNKKSKFKYEKNVEVSLFNGIKFETFKELAKEKKGENFKITFVSLLNKESDLDIKENVIDSLENWIDKIKNDEETENFGQEEKIFGKCERIKIDRDDDDKRKIKGSKLRRRNKKNVVDKSVRYANKRNIVSQQEKVVNKTIKDEITFDQDNMIKNIQYVDLETDKICESNDTIINIEKNNLDGIKSSIEDKDKINKDMIDEKIQLEGVKNAEGKDEPMTEIKKFKKFIIKKRVTTSAKCILPENTKKNIKIIREVNSEVTINSSNEVTINSTHQVLPNAECENLPCKRLRSAAQYIPVIDLIPSKQAKN